MSADDSQHDERTPRPIDRAEHAEREAHPVERVEPSPTGSDLEHAHDELTRTWRVPRGFIGWFMVADHRTIGIRYIVTAFVFFTLAGILAALMRLQLAVPENRFLGPDLYNQIFTTHGATMMFLFAVPIMEGFGLYFVPLMIGARNVAFPRLMTFSYWTYLFGGLLFWGCLLYTSPSPRDRG